MEQILKSEIVAIFNKIQRGSAPRLTDNIIVPGRIIFRVPGTLLVLACAAAAADLRTGQIPNRLIATGLCCALLGNLLQSGYEGVFSSLLGGAVPLLTLYLLFTFHMIGAGDIKFLINIFLAIFQIKLLYY